MHTAGTGMQANCEHMVVWDHVADVFLLHFWCMQSMMQHGWLYGDLLVKPCIRCMGTGGKCDHESFGGSMEDFLREELPKKRVKDFRRE